MSSDSGKLDFRAYDLDEAEQWGWTGKTWIYESKGDGLDKMRYITQKGIRLTGKA